MSAGKSVVSIWNLALQVVGVRGRVAAENEKTKEAEICQDWYEPIRDQILCAAYWGSARAVATLPLLSERDFNLTWQATDPEEPWAFLYGVPKDFLYPRFLTDFTNFTMTNQGEARAVLANTYAGNMVYTKRQTNVSIWEEDLYLAVVHGLASAIGEPLSGKRLKVERAIAIANEILLKAQLNTANEQQVQHDNIPDWLAARGVGAGTSFSQFIHPYGPLLSTVSPNDA